MREDEENCKIVFDEFLRIRYQDDAITWQPGSEPPDYYLSLCGTKYAVEVTNLFEDTKHDDKTMSHLGFRRNVLFFLKQVEHKARQEGILNGAYVVGYKPLKNFDKQQKSILENIMNYMRANQSDSSAPAGIITGSGRLAWDIIKVHSEKQYLIGTTVDTKHESEAMEDLCIFLDQTLEKKAKKLVGISYPKILLINDRYPWIERSDWNKCLLNLNQLSEFHTIFLVSRDRGNSVLYSVERTWLNKC